MSTLKELIDRNKKRRKSQVKEDVEELIHSLMMSQEMLCMIQESFEELGLDTSQVPLMFYPEALKGFILEKLKQAGALPGIPATVRYELIEPEESDNERVNQIRATLPPAYRCIEIEKEEKDAPVHIRPDANVA